MNKHSKGTREHLYIRVRGKVQGVFFRASTQEQARSLGVQGWVMNHADGSVRIAAEAEPEILQAFLAWLHEGLQLARVDELQSSRGELQYFQDFSIR